MSRTKAQQKKQQKKKARQKRIRKDVNQRKNSAPPRYGLNILYDDAWRFAKNFTSMAGVDNHCEDTERRREAGELIVPGKVVDLRTNEVVKEIAGSKPKGSLPDKLAGKPEAVKKAKPGLISSLVKSSKKEA